MSFPFYSVPITFGLAMIPHFVKFALLRPSNRYETGRPDLGDFEGKCTKGRLALARRMQAAHQNGLESLPLFAAGVAACLAVNAPIDSVAPICAVHVAARVVYYVLYALPPVAGGYLRSLVWGTSVGASVYLWTTAAKFY